MYSLYHCNSYVRNKVFSYFTYLLAKTASKKIGALSHSMKFLSPEMRLLSISVNLSYANVWNAVVTSGLVPLVATRNC